MTTTLRAADGRVDIAVNDAEKAAARAFRPALASTARPAAPALVDVQVPSELLGLISRLVEAVATGETITIGTLPRELSTVVAAQQLGVSRPTLMKWVTDGSLPAHKVGTHTRVKTSDVVAFRKKRVKAQRAAFDRLRELDDELGLE